MDSTSFFADGGRQLNLGWTVTNRYNVYMVYLGIFLIFISFAVICLKSDYANQIKSKKAVLNFSFIGFVLIFWGIYNTYNNFSSTVLKIKNDIAKKGICSIFVEETAASTFQNIVSDFVLPYEINNSLQEKIRDKLDSVRDESNDFIFKKKLPNATDSELNLGTAEDEMPTNDVIESALQQIKDNFLTQAPPQPSTNNAYRVVYKSENPQQVVQSTGAQVAQELANNPFINK